jgi:hypothetical protein
MTGAASGQLFVVSCGKNQQGKMLDEANMAAAVSCRIIIIIAIILPYHFVVPADVSEQRPIDIPETTASSPWSPWSQSGRFAPIRSGSCAMTLHGTYV